MEVKCPTCGNPAIYAPSNPFRPFCSERCKLIDLGAWADGKYAIPVNSPQSGEALEELADESALEDSASDEEPEDPRH
jgi:endogenous inhibitor of DNA gyrase (YacG/DUF329 family)